MALADQTDGIVQIGEFCRSSRGKQQMHSEVPESLIDSPRPWNKNHPKEQLVKKENASQNKARQLQTSQELDNRETKQHHTSTTVPREKSHKGLAPVRPIQSSG
jgi:hypothetical protein